MEVRLAVRAYPLCPLWIYHCIIFNADCLSRKSCDFLSYNTIQKVYFLMEATGPYYKTVIITIIMMSGKLEYTFVINLTKLDILYKKLLFKLIMHKIAIMVLAPKAPITTSHPLLSPAEILKKPLGQTMWLKSHCSCWTSLTLVHTVYPQRLP